MLLPIVLNVVVEHSLDLMPPNVPHVLLEVSQVLEAHLVPTVPLVLFPKMILVPDVLQDPSLNLVLAHVLLAKLVNSLMSMPPHVLLALLVLHLSKEAQLVQAVSLVLLFRTTPVLNVLQERSLTTTLPHVTYALLEPTLLMPAHLFV